MHFVHFPFTNFLTTLRGRTEVVRPTGAAGPRRKVSRYHLQTLTVNRAGFEPEWIIFWNLVTEPEVFNFSVLHTPLERRVLLPILSVYRWHYRPFRQHNPSRVASANSATYSFRVRDLARTLAKRVSFITV